MSDDDDVGRFPLDDIQQRKRKCFCQHAANRTADYTPTLRVENDFFEPRVDLVDKSRRELGPDCRVVPHGVIEILLRSGMEPDLHRPIERRASLRTSSAE